MCVQAEGNDVSDGHAHAGSAHTLLLTVASLLHAIAQHLIGRNKHNTDDESHGEGADQALANTRLSVLLCWMDWNNKKIGILRQLSLMSQQISQDGHKCNYILLFQVIVVSITRIMTGLGKMIVHFP